MDETPSNAAALADLPAGMHEGPEGHLLRSAPPRHAIDLPPEATHRRFQAPRIIKVSQAAAGFTALAVPDGGLHYVKLIGAFVTLDAAGTLQFFQGAGTSATSGTDAALTGTVGIALNGGFVLPVVDPKNPWLWTDPNQTLSINTATGKAQGWLVVCMAPHDQ